MGEDPLEGRLTGIDDKLDDQQRTLTEISSKIGAIRRDVQELGESLLEAFQISIDEVKDRVDTTALEEALALR